jgi:N-acetylglucosamine-6-phosphate deacetylase
VHGAAGVDIMQGGDAGATVARAHARHGTTAMLGTTMTATDNSIRRALRGLAPRSPSARPAPRACWACIWKARSSASTGSARSRPMRSRRQPGPGAQLSRHGADTGHDAGHRSRRHLQLIPQLKELGIRVQLGHSNGSYEDGVAALQAGAAGFTHLFNGMTALQHYKPGIVGAALAHAEYAEIIPTCSTCMKAPSALRCAPSRACTA